MYEITSWFVKDEKKVSSRSNFQTRRIMKVEEGGCFGIRHEKLKTKFGQDLLYMTQNKQNNKISTFIEINCDKPKKNRFEKNKFSVVIGVWYLIIEKVTCYPYSYF